MLTIAFVKALGMLILINVLCSTNTLDRLCGQYRKYFELFIILVYPIPFMLSGTISGPIIAMLSGVLVSSAFELRKHLVGCQVYEGGIWIRLPGDWSSNAKARFDTFWYGEPHE